MEDQCNESNRVYKYQMNKSTPFIVLNHDYEENIVFKTKHTVSVINLGLCFCTGFPRLSILKERGNLI